MKRALLIFPSLLIAITMSFAPMSVSVSNGLSLSGNNAYAACGPNEIEVSIPVLSGGSKCVSNDPSKGGAIVAYTKDIIKLAVGAIGSVILLMLLIAGVQYITASGDPGRTKAAKTRITNAIIALLLFLMANAILAFLGIWTT